MDKIQIISRELKTENDCVQWFKDMKQAKLDYCYDVCPLGDTTKFNEQEAEILDKTVGKAQEILGGAFDKTWVDILMETL